MRSRKRRRCEQQMQRRAPFVRQLGNSIDEHAGVVRIAIQRDVRREASRVPGCRRDVGAVENRGAVLRERACARIDRPERRRRGRGRRRFRIQPDRRRRRQPAQRAARARPRRRACRSSMRSGRASCPATARDRRASRARCSAPRAAAASRRRSRARSRRRSSAYFDQLQVVASAGVRRHDGERRCNELLRAFEFAALEVDHPQHVHGVERARMLRDHRLVQRDRLGVAARLLRGERGPSWHAHRRRRPRADRRGAASAPWQSL